jgi:hypothetical protein
MIKNKNKNKTNKTKQNKKKQKKKKQKQKKTKKTGLFPCTPFFFFFLIYSYLAIAEKK